MFSIFLLGQVLLNVDCNERIGLDGSSLWDPFGRAALMALPTHASTLERVWHYAYLVICGLVFLFLIAPILVIIPLSFNAED